MTDQTTDNADEWITVRDIARLLNITERHAQRKVSALPDNDRRKTEGGPTLARRTALIQSQDAGPTLPDIAPVLSDAMTDVLHQEIDRLRDTVARLEEEKKVLMTDKDRLYGLLLAVQTDASEWRRMLLLDSHLRIKSALDEDAPPAAPVRAWWAWWKRSG